MCFRMIFKLFYFIFNKFCLLFLVEGFMGKGGCLYRFSLLKLYFLREKFFLNFQLIIENTYCLIFGGHI